MALEMNPGSEVPFKYPRRSVKLEGCVWTAHLQLVQPPQEGLPGAGHLRQKVLLTDDVEDLGQQQVLGGVAHPGVEDTVRLEEKNTQPTT